MAAIEFFEYIRIGLSTWLGYEWIAYAILGIALLSLTLIVLKVDPIIGVVFVSLPFILYAMFANLDFGWGLAALGILVGISLFAALIKIFSART